MAERGPLRVPQVQGDTTAYWGITDRVEDIFPVACQYVRKLTLKRQHFTLFSFRVCLEKDIHTQNDLIFLVGTKHILTMNC